MPGITSNIFVRLALLMFSATLVEHSVAAKEFCALSVELLDSEGAPAKLTPVQLINSSGEIVFDQQVSGSMLHICDFGLGRHKLVVGYGFCYPITISNL
jgi:hypothetical protein